MQLIAGVGVQFDGKAPARHAKALNFLLHGAGQACGCLLAQVAQLAGFLLVMSGERGKFVAQSLNGFVVGVKGFNFIQQLLLHRRHFGRLNAMFACQGVDGIQALLYFLQAGWVGIEVVEKAIELSHGFFNLDLCAGQ